MQNDAKDGAHSGNQTWQSKTLLVDVSTLFYKSAPIKFYKLFSYEKKRFPHGSDSQIAALQVHVAWLLWKNPQEARKVYWAFWRQRHYKAGEWSAFKYIYISLGFTMFHYVSLCITMYHYTSLKSLYSL